MWIALVSVLVVGAIVAFFVLRSAGTPGTGKGGTGKPRPQEQRDSEYVQRLGYLLKIVLEHSASDRRESSTREVIRIGQSVNEAGGFRYMVKIHEAVTRSTSPKVGSKLKSLWKGIGDWRG